MKAQRLFPLLLFITGSLYAQGRFAITASAVRSDMRRDTRLSYAQKTGFGASLDYFWTRAWATEVSASWTRPEVLERAVSTTYRYGETRMMPVTGSLQFHLAPISLFDLYLGGGAAWVRLSDLKGSPDLSDLDVDRVRFDHRTGPMGQAGLTFGSWRGVGLNIDAKYIDVKTRSQATFTDGTTSNKREINLSPWLWSAGLRWRF